MPIDPYILSRLRLLEGLGDRTDLATDPEAAARFAEYQQDTEAYAIPDLDIVDSTIDGPHGRIPIRIYRPLDSVDDLRPGLLWLHGGGFRAGTLDWNEGHTVSAELAHRAGAVVVSVDYRLAVDGVHHPVPLDDVVAAWTWFAASSDDLGVDASRTSIGGASAGGNLALAAIVRVAQSDGELPTSALLAYPVVHYPVPALPDTVYAEMTTLPPMLRFFSETNEEMFGSYVGRTTDFPPDVTPGQADLSAVPPTWILVSEYDDLRPSCELLGRQLTSLGKAVHVHLAEGMLHGHLNRTPVVPEVDRSLTFFAQGLQTTNGPG